MRENLPLPCRSQLPMVITGPINLLLAIDREGKCAAHASLVTGKLPDWEDRIESRRSNTMVRWVSLATAWKTRQMSKWKVKKDGGVFDQFTGCTITPRKIVKAVHSALMFVDSNPGVFFDE